jgi:hypothetical protein
MFWSRLFVFTLCFSLAPVGVFAHEADNCAKRLDSARVVAEVRHDDQAAELAKWTSERVAEDLEKKGVRKIEARGYAILIAAMVGSAAATTYLTALLPPNFQFLSQLVQQISTLGVYVFGAPIWEPLSSGFRKLAFGVRGAGREAEEGSARDPELESLWRRTQESYSLNAQMSRNVISQFIISVQQNFYEAHRAIQTQNVDYASDQVAEAAYRLRTLFKDIPPTEPSIATVVRATFTNHIAIDQAFVDLVMLKISRLDRYSETELARDYYRQIVDLWLRQVDA